MRTKATRMDFDGESTFEELEIWIANMSGSGRMELVMLSADSKNVCVA